MKCLHALILGVLLAPQPPRPVAIDPGDPSTEVIGNPAEQALDRRADWLGLYKRDGAWRLGRARVDVVAGRLDEMPTYRFVVEPVAPRLLLSAVRGVNPGAVVVASEAVSLSHQTRSIGLTLGKRRYVVALQSRDADYCDAVVTLTSAGVRQTLYSPKTAGRTADPALRLSCDEPHFEIRWAGDLDRDGRLDLLVTFSPKYSYHPQRLFLSSAASPKALVGAASLYELSAA